MNLVHLECLKPKRFSGTNVSHDSMKALALNLEDICLVLYTLEALWFSWAYFMTAWNSLKARRGTQRHGAMSKQDNQYKVLVDSALFYPRFYPIEK